MAPQPTLRERILDSAAAKDLDIEAIAKAADMPLNYLQAIVENDREKLPAFPYVRAHLASLAEVLDLDPVEVSSAYKREFDHRISGSRDLLPGNRFALPKKGRLIAILVGVVVVLGVVTLLWGPGVLGEPDLLVTNPPATPQPFIVTTSTIILRGKIDPRDKLLINDQIVPVEPDGSFARPYNFDPDINFIEFRVERLLGGSTRVVREVFYESVLIPTNTNSSTVPTPTSTLEDTTTSTSSVLEEPTL